MVLTVVRGERALQLLGQPEFRRRWADLCARCPWATVFQGPDFAVAWYTAYRGRFDPALVLREGADGRLDGILALATAAPDRGRRTVVGGLVVVGAWQAEYQSWVCAPEIADEFATQLVEAIRTEWPKAGLRFRYLPHGTPLGWVGAGNVKVRPHRRPLLRFGDDGRGIEQSLCKNKKSRDKLRRMQRLGVVELRQLTTVDELDDVLDDIVAHHDTRHLDVHGSADFLDDPDKAPFHRAMVAAGNVLVTTVLTVDGDVVSSHLDARSRHEVHTGVIAHSPWFAKHGMGKLHVYLLARLLLEQGFQQLDLTPGTDQYKWRFANAWDEVHTLELPPARVSSLSIRATVRRVTRAMAGRARRLATARGSLPAVDLQAGLREARRQGMRGVVAALRQRRSPWTDPQEALHFYTRELGPDENPAPVPADSEAAPVVARNQLGDLLHYRPSPAQPSRRTFIAIALRRIGQGQQFYTCVEDGRLVLAVWLSGPSAPPDATTAPVVPPAGTLLLHGLRTDPAAGGDGGVEQLLRAVLQDAAKDGSGDVVLAAVGADDAATGRALHATGFRRMAAVPESSVRTEGDVRPSAVR